MHWNKIQHVLYFNVRSLLPKIDNLRSLGVMIFVKNMFTFSLLFEGTLNCECLVMSVTCCSSVSPDFTIALLYRPPSSGQEPLDSLFSTLCNIFY